MQKRTIRILVYFTLLVLCLCVTLPTILQKWNMQNLPGSRDFIHYYAAAKLFLAGANPYDLGALKSLSDELGRGDTDPVVQWIYPSWVLPVYLLVLLPATLLPFSGAVVFWGVLNLLLLCAAGIVIWRGVSKGLPTPLLPVVLLGSILFVPALDSIVYGQISILVLFGTACFFYYAEKGKDYRASFFLLLPASKATVWYLLIPFLAWWIIRNRRWKIPAGFLAFVILFSAIGEIWVPGLFRYWLKALPYSHAHIMKFRNPSLVDVVNNEIFKAMGEIASWPEVVIPLLVALSLLLYLLFRKPRAELNPLLFPVLMLSVATAPYCWFFDQVVLVIAQVALLAYAFDARVSAELRKRIIGMLIFLQAITFISTIFLFDDQFYFWWHPWALLGIWTYAYSKLRLSLRVE